MANVQHDSRERGTSLSLLGNRVPSKRACCFDVLDLIRDSTKCELTKRFYWWPCRFRAGARKMRSKLTEVSRFIPCLRNSESVGVLSSLAGRNVQSRIVGCFSSSSMCGGLCVSVCFLQRCLSSKCVGGCVFPAFVIQNLWMC